MAASTLSLVGKLSDISFCDKKCSNVNNNDFKEDFIRMIDEKYDIRVVDKVYSFLNPSILKNVSYHQHLLTPLTNGNPYLLYLTRVDDVNCCFYIDRKLKGGFSFPKIHCVKYQFSDELFNDTIFSGELVRDRQRKWFFLIDNILLYKGEKTNNKNIVNKFEMIYDIFNNYYKENSMIEPCPIQIKRLFPYSQIKNLVNKFIPSLSYYCKGLVFYNLNTKYSNYSMLFPRNKVFHLPSQDEIMEKIRVQKPSLWLKTQTISKQENDGFPSDDLVDNIKSGSSMMENKAKDIVINEDVPISENNIVFKVIHTNMPDVYNIYIFNEEKSDLVKYDHALVPNLKTSKMLRKIFTENKNSIDICMECRYSPSFKKWVPIRCVKHEPYTISDIEKHI